MQGLTFISILIAVVTAVFWLVIGWRAMRAHERIADAATEWIEKQRPQREPYPTFAPTPFTGPIPTQKTRPEPPATI